MTLARLPGRLADELHERIARIDRIGIGARMADTACPVQFPSCNTRQADMRPLGAPDGSIAVPYADRRTLE